VTRIGLLSDLHWADADAGAAWHNPYDFAGVRGRVRAALRWMAEERVDLIAVTGDLCHGGEPAALAAVVEALAGAAPVRFVHGNHDPTAGHDARRLDTRAGSIADRRDASLAGAPETVAGLRVCGVPVRPGAGWFAARVEPPPELDVAGDDPLIVLSHFPLVSFAAPIAERGFAYPGDGVGRESVLTALRARRAPSIVLSGHIHARAAATDGSLLQLVSAPMIEPPYEAAIVTIERTGGDLTVHRETRGLPGPAPRHPFPDLAPEHPFTYRDGAWSAAPDRPATAMIAGGIS